MTKKISDMPQRTAARVSGFGYLIITILAIFSEFFVRSKLVVPGDAATTVVNILANEMLFRIGICGYLIVAILDIVVALALYVLLKPVNKSLALLAAWFRLVYAVILGIALQNLLSVLQLLGGADYLAAFKTGELHAQVMLLLNAHSDGWLIGLVFFGLHCLVLGYLIFKSGYIPRILGALLVAASFGYVIDSFAHFLLPNYSDYKTPFLLLVAVPAFIGELSFTFWLLFKGVKIQRTQVAPQ